MKNGTIILILALIIGFYGGYEYRGKGITETIDTVQVIEYIPVADTSFTATAIDSVNAEHEKIQSEYVQKLIDEALRRDDLLTEADSLRAINKSLMERVTSFSRLQVIPLKIEGCGLVTVVYNPITGEADVAVTNRPPLKLETVYITTTKIIKEHDWRMTGWVIAGLTAVYLVIQTLLAGLM